MPFGYIISRHDELTIPPDTEVIVVSDQTCLSKFQRKQLVVWAKGGGKLIVTGDSGRCDELNRQFMKNPFKEQLAGLANVLIAVAKAVAGVKGVHKPRARRYGSSFQADIHIQVDGGLSVAEGHAIGHAVKEAVVNADLDVDDIVVHVEPWDQK